MSYASTVIADGASHYWRLGEATGTVAADQIGGAPGTISGGVTLGQPGPLADGSTAMAFDGSTAQIFTPTVAVPVPSTVEAWMQTAVVANQFAFSNRSTGVGVGLAGTTPGVYDDGLGLITGTTPVNDGLWHHVVFLFDGTTATFYVDGVRGAAPAFPYGGRTNLGAIGSDRPANLAAPWDGRLAEIAIYPLALSPAQIANHYALRLPAGRLLLEDGTSYLLLDDGSSHVLLETLTGATDITFLRAASTITVAASGDVRTIPLAAAATLAWSASGDVRTIPLAATATITFAGTAKIVQAARFDVAARLAIGSTHATLSDPDAVTPVGPIHARLEVQLTPGVWTNLARDVCATPPVHFVRGCTTNGPLDHVAAIGTLEFDLRNDSGNSGGVQGWYSPYHADVRPGWTYGIPVRIVSMYQSVLHGDLGPVDRPVWRGKITSIAPAPGTHLSRRVSVTAEDCMGDLAANDAVSIPPQLGQNEVQLLTAVLNAMPTTAQPPATSFDAPLDTYTYAFDNLGSGVKGMSAVTDVVLSGYGWLYPLADGTLRYENRQSRVRRTAQASFRDGTMNVLAVPSDLANVFNRVRVTTHPRTLDATPTTVLVAATGAMAISPGQTIETLDNYRVQGTGNTWQLIGGTGFVLPLVAHTDYAGNTASDSSGVDITASLSITVTPFAAAAKFSITNTGTTAGFVTIRQLRGKGIYDNGPVTFETYLPQAYGDRPLDFDLAYQTDAGVAAGYADAIAHFYAAPINHADTLGYAAIRSDKAMTHALTREIGDTILGSETMTGLAMAPLSILGIDGSITVGSLLLMQYVVAPTGTGVAFTLNDPVYGVLDSPQGPLWYA